MLIYKIMTGPEWAAFQNDGVFSGAPVDLADGFIHFSTADQARETAAKHFAGQSDLQLVWMQAARFGETLKWEVSRGGAKFPHLYGTFALEDVAGSAALPFGTGGHIFPEGIA